MKQIHPFLAALSALSVVAAVSCKQDPVIPSVEVTALNSGTTSISFSIVPENASTVRYEVLPASEGTAPSADELLAGGKEADASAQKTYTEEGLEPDSEYSVYVVAQSSTGNNSPVESIKVRTSAVPVPSVQITPGEATETSVSFTLVPENADQARYVVVEASQTVPSADEIIASGKEADASQAAEYTEDGLKADTEYVVAAAAKGADGTLTEVVKANVRTDKPAAIVPTVTIESVSVELDKATISYTSDKAETCWLLVLEASQPAPDAEAVSAEGTECAGVSGQTEVTLSYETEYVAYMAARSSDGTFSSVASESFATEQKPAPSVQVGDYYYSDGTLSSGSADPEAGKTVIGVVFKVGRDESDANSYKTADGSADLSEVTGYVVALTDGVYVDEDDWFNPNKTDYEWEGDFKNAGTSEDITVFNGYSNTMAIKAKAEELHGSLSFAWNNFKACYVVHTYWNETVPAPAMSSGWYFPSVAEIKAFMQAREAVEASIVKAGGKAYSGADRKIWSSNEHPETNTLYVYTVSLDPATESGTEVMDRRDRAYPARAILAF